MKFASVEKRKVTCIALDQDQTTLNHQGRLSERNWQPLVMEIMMQMVLPIG